MQGNKRRRSNSIKAVHRLEGLLEEDVYDRAAWRRMSSHMGTKIKTNNL